MAAGSVESQRPRTASERPVAGQAGVLPCLELPSYAAACALVGSRYSCLVAAPHRRHIALSPRYLSRKRTGIREQLDAELLRYSESLLGVPIAYDNIRVVGELGDIYDDQGHIHLNIEADFVIFCPEPGQKLMGTVNKVSSSHIGCLVHGCFNASIPKPEQMSYEEWQTLEIHVGDELEFDVFRLDSDSAGVFCIRGKLNTTSLQLKRSEVSEDVAETVIEEVVEKTPKKKKKKKDKDTETVGSVTEVADVTDVTPKEEADIPCSHNVNGFFEEEPKKKKKKKKKDKDTETCGTVDSVTEVADVTETCGTVDSVTEVADVTETCGTVDSVTEVADVTDVMPKEEADRPCSDNVNGFSEEEPRKKKKKKKRHQEDQDPIFQASDSSGYQSDHNKKKKKRKHSEEANFESPKKRQ